MHGPGVTVRSGPAFDHAREQVDRLLAPLSTAELVDDYWGRRPYYGLRERPQPFLGLPSEQDVEYLLSSLTAPESGWFSLVKQRGRPPDGSFLTAEGWLDLSEVYVAHRDGHSLLLNQVQKRHAETGRLCRLLEMALTAHGLLLARHIGANLYLSPPQSQGFSTHYDPHDVLILHLEGVKHWHVYERRIANPLRPPDAPFTPEEAGPVARTFMVSPGDIIYIPRGVLHDAYTGQESSLHLTLSIELATWRDLFGTILANDPQFQECLPRGFAADGRFGGDAAIRAKARALAKSELREAALATVRTLLLNNLDRLPAAGPSRAATHADLDGDTRFSLAEGVFGEVRETADQAILHVPGTSIATPPQMAATFRYLLSVKSFRARDLPIETSLEQKVNFLRGLALDSLIVPSRETPD